MNKILIIIGREFSTRVKKKSFLITTIAVPLLFVAFYAFLMWMMLKKDTQDRQIAVINASFIETPLEKINNTDFVYTEENISQEASADYLQKNGYYGSLQWDGNDYRYSYLNDIPFHVNAMVGDTIVTSGFSTIFPEGRLIGFVESVNKETANFLSIKVKLATDFKRILDVYVIAHTKRQEQRQLENESYE